MISERDRQKLNQRAPSPLLEATVLDPPVDEEGFLRVELDNAPGQTITSPWMPRLDVDVAAGDAAVVISSDAAHFWCVEWWSQSGAPPKTVGGGADWFVLTAEPPDPALGDVGDLAIVSSSGNFYEKAAGGVWQLRGSLRGPTGPAGPQGATGPAGPTGGQGPAGSAGPQGPQGVAGAAGAAGRSAYQVWLDAGNVGDVNAYLASLVGPQGPAGPTGPAGTLQTLEGWHTVGAAGEPAFAAGWSSIAGSAVQFRKDPFGRVHLRGFANAGGSPVGRGFTVFTLPATHRPAQTHYFATWVNNAAGSGIEGAGTFSVSPTGAVSLYAQSGNGYGLSCSFDTDSVTSVLAGEKGDQGDPGAEGPPWLPTDYTMDPWHTVGDATTGLGTAYNTNWAALGGAEMPPSFTKDPMGRVLLRGIPQRTGTLSVTERVFTLPVGYRPPKLQRFTCWSNIAGAGTVSRLYVDVNGDVMYVPGASGATHQPDLSQIEFDTDTVTTMLAGPKGDPGPVGPPGDAPGLFTLDPWHLVGAAGEPAFGTGWSNYGGGFQSLAFRKHPDGRVSLRGLITGAAGVQANMFVLPVGYRPPVKEIFTEIADGAISRIDILADGTVQRAGGTNGYVSLSSVEFDTDTVTTVPAGPKGDPGPQGPPGDAPTLYTLDTWHVVGDAATGLGTTFGGSPHWASTAGLPTVAFKKSPDGKVRLRGAAQRSISTSGVGDVVIQGIPAAYRPPGSVVLTAPISGFSTLLRVDVQANGTIILQTAGVAPGSWIPLDDVEWDTDTATTMLAGPRGDAGPSGSTAYNLPTARCATTGNLDLTAVSPATVDGVAPLDGDLVLVWAQTDKKQNGLYQWRTAQPMLRYADAAVNITLLAGTRVYVRGGTLFGQRDFYLRDDGMVGYADLAFSPPRGAIISDQVIRGNSASLSAQFTNPGTAGRLLDRGDGTNMQLLFTPPVDCWWEVFGFVGYVVKIDAAYGYLYGGVQLTPADGDGVSRADSLVTQHSGVQQYEPRIGIDLFKLAAGVPYTLGLYLFGDSGTLGTWAHYRSSEFLKLIAKATVR